MKAQTKTFRRLLRKCIVKANCISSKKARRAIKKEHNLTRLMHQNYLKQGKQYLLNAYGIKQPVLQLPPSMPKGAADKIASFEDYRMLNKGAGIHIKLKSGYQFADGYKLTSVSNVKEAIAVMRTVETV